MNNKKKVGIVSCYFQHNYGSMLQAYATQMALDRLGYENETIDISGFRGDIRKKKIKYFIKASLTSDILFYKAGMAKSVIKKKFSKNTYASLSEIRGRRFDGFSRSHFRLSERYPSREVLRNACAERYSTVLAGSDQLWLPANIAADYYTLSFVPDTLNTVAYATSFGQASLPKDTAAKASRFLKNIRHIGVREESGQKLVWELANRRVPIVCDPTLLFSGDEWMTIQKQEPLIHGKYILCYFLGKNALHREFAMKLKKASGCRIAALPHLDEYIKEDENYADELLYDIDPADFINLIRNAEYICTDSFHCSAFSILYRKQFFAFRRYRKETRQSTNSRLDSLFHILNISERLLTGTEPVIDCMKIETDYTDGMYLVANPAWSYDTSSVLNQNEENFINKAGIAFRAYRLEKDMKYKVYNIDAATPFNVGDGLKFEGGKYVEDDGGSPKLKVVAVEDFGFPFCVGSQGTANGNFGYAVGETMKKYTIEVVA